MAKLEQAYATSAYFVLLYTREFNPRMGRFADLDDPTTLEGRLALARRLKADFDRAGREPIWVVDSMANALHTAYGSPKGASIVVARGGRVAFKGAWASPAAVEAALAPLAGGDPTAARRELDADLFVPLLPSPPAPRSSDARAGLWVAPGPARPWAGRIPPPPAAGRPSPPVGADEGRAGTVVAAAPAASGGEGPTITLRVAGMVCQGCAISVREAVLRVPHVAGARLAYRPDAPGELVVTTRPGASEADVRQAVVRTGFTVIDSVAK